MSGIRSAIALKRQGLTRIAVLEKAEEVGGVWNHNRYPGVGCDVPSPIYAYGFKPHRWRRLFAQGDEIREYFKETADETGVTRHVRLGTELLDASWDDSLGVWICTTNKGTFRSPILVLATGVLHSKAVPTVPGASTFTGQTFHSSEWPSDFDPTGKRIAVVGTGASAIQFVPEIQPLAKRLVVLQRTAPWIVPKPDVIHPQSTSRRDILRQRLMRYAIWAVVEFVLLTVKHPRFGASLEWIARKHLHDSVQDPELREILTPEYMIGCKRMLLSSAWYPAICSSNVDYVPSALREIKPNTIVAENGEEYAVDTIIWGTGFNFGQQVLDRVRGRDGRTLTERFGETPRTYRATTVVECPNLFIIAGPHAGTASITTATEAQVRYLESAIATMRRKNLEWVEPRPAVEKAWMERKESILASWVWNTGGCTSYYLNSKGENVSAWPGHMLGMVRSLRTFDIENYIAKPSRDLRCAENAAPVTKGEPLTL